MVPFLEIAFVVAAVGLGVWRLRRTNLYRARRSSGGDPGQHGSHRAL
jgi:hypothetical protein